MEQVMPPWWLFRCDGQMYVQVFGVLFVPYDSLLAYKGLTTTSLKGSILGNLAKDSYTFGYKTSDSLRTPATELGIKKASWGSWSSEACRLYAKMCWVKLH